eukprot:4361718-Pleurochrysis_carterae.AAC.2
MSRERERVQDAGDEKFFGQGWVVARAGRRRSATSWLDTRRPRSCLVAVPADVGHGHLAPDVRGAQLPRLLLLDLRSTGNVGARVRHLIRWSRSSGKAVGRGVFKVIRMFQGERFISMAHQGWEGWGRGNAVAMDRGRTHEASNRL